MIQTYDTQETPEGDFAIIVESEITTRADGSLWRVVSVHHSIYSCYEVCIRDGTTEWRRKVDKGATPLIESENEEE